MTLRDILLHYVTSGNVTGGGVLLQRGRVLAQL